MKEVNQAVDLKTYVHFSSVVLSQICLKHLLACWYFPQHTPDLIPQVVSSQPVKGPESCY